MIPQLLSIICWPYAQESIRSSRFDFFFILYAISCVKISVSPSPTAYSFLAIKATHALIRAILGSPLPAINGSIRSEEHTSELQSLMRISYAVLCLQKTKTKYKTNTQNNRINET